ncbi:MAG: RcpC/CpaB family pilus assembly protein [Dermatophilaceae bacterium]
MNRRIIAILSAVVMALVGGAMVLVYARGADARALSGQNATRAYVAAKLIPSGTSLKDAQRTGLITETDVATKGLPTGALAAIDADNSALLALSDVQPGEFLMTSRFGTTPVGSKAIEIPSGMLAVSVQLTDPGRVGTFVRPGTHLAIYDSFTLKSLGDDPKSKIINDHDIKQTNLLLADVLVIGVGDTPLAAPVASPTGDAAAKSGAQQSNVASFLVTVAVTPQESTRLVHGINTGTLYAALRGSDVKLDPQTSVNDVNLFNLVLP